MCTGNENSKPIWNKFIIRKDIIETNQVVLNFCRTVYKNHQMLKTKVTIQIILHNVLCQCLLIMLAFVCLQPEKGHFYSVLTSSCYDVTTWELGIERRSLNAISWTWNSVQSMLVLLNFLLLFMETPKIIRLFIYTF